MSTPHQRLYIRCLLGQLEYPTHKTSLQYRIPFEGAGLAPPAPDIPVDPVLEKLTNAEASKLIASLQKLTP